MTEDSTEALIEAAQPRDFREDARKTGGDPDRESDGALVDGDLTPADVIGRSLGPEWNEHFKYAKSKGNSNKAACIYADSRV
jgi:hypothetical protein